MTRAQVRMWRMRVVAHRNLELADHCICQINKEYQNISKYQNDMKYQHICNINIFAIIRKHQYIMKTSTYQENISISVITCETGMLRAPRPGCVSSSMATTCYILHLKHFKISVGQIKRNLMAGQDPHTGCGDAVGPCRGPQTPKV